MKGITVCNGKPVDFGNQLESAVEECLETRSQDLNPEFELTDKDGAKVVKKKEKKKEKQLRKMKRKCRVECEWKAYDMVRILYLKLIVWINYLLNIKLFNSFEIFYACQTHRSQM